MKSYFAYIRVSTAEQGEEHSASLPEQRDAIEAYAQRSELRIAEWFTETRTAAKQGRTVFNRLLADLERGRAAGVIIHKIDRSARNLRDWAKLGELMDRGIDVRFAHDNLDLSTRGGRLSADIQAVVAADFIRNLRDEVRKGQRGRLKQGLYPFKAPRGYVDRGKGQPKTIDPIEGPLVQQAYELYGSGNYGLHQLRMEMARRGLCGPGGRALGFNAMSRLLKNPFYMGLIRVPSSCDVYQGVHEPLVQKRQFDRVQAILSGRLYPRTEIHQYLYRRLINCARCGRSLTGERQKGHVYYRCHDRGCQGVSLLESHVTEVVRAGFACLRLDERDVGDLRDIIKEQIEEDNGQAKLRATNLKRALGLIEERLARLTDAMLDGLVDPETYTDRKSALIAHRLELQQEEQSGSNSTSWKDVAERFELGFAALSGFDLGNDVEKREILKTVGSNLLAEGKTLVFPMSFPFHELREWVLMNQCAPDKSAVRTLKRKAAIRSLLKSWQ